MLLVLMILPTNNLKAQTTTEEITAVFFNLLDKSPEDAFKFLFKDKDMSRTDKQSIENLKEQFLNSVNSSGVYNGYEKIMERSLGKSLKLVSYMIKYETFPIRFTTVFYKPKDTWLLFETDFDINLIKELKNSRKDFSVYE